MLSQFIVTCVRYIVCTFGPREEYGIDGGEDGYPEGWSECDCGDGAGGCSANLELPNSWLRKIGDLQKRCD
jgi:hypothetical protein